MAYLDKGICKGVFSRNWIYRDKYMKVIADEVMAGSGSQRLNFDDPAELFVAVFGACSYTINDKIAQVTMQSMRTLNTVNYICNSLVNRKCKS